MKKVLIILTLMAFWGQSMAQLIARLEVNKDTIVYDSLDRSIPDQMDIVTDKLWGRAFEFQNQLSSGLAFDSLSPDGFVLSFWFSPRQVNGKQSLINHQTADLANQLIFELQIDSSHLVVTQHRPELSPEIKKSKATLAPQNWYYVIYSCNKDQTSLKVRSTDFRFDATFFTTALPPSILTFGNNQQVMPFEGLLNKVNLYSYSASRFNGAQTQYDREESELYTYHRNLELQTAKLNREVTTKDTVRINESSIRIDIWDYDEVDRDILYVWSDATTSIYPGKEGRVREVDKMDVAINSKKEKYTFQVHLPTDKVGELYFSAKDMGFIRELNTAVVQIYTLKEVWDTIHINPTELRDMKIPFEYDPFAQPPVDLNRPQEIDLSPMDGTVSKSQLIFLRVSDFSLPDGDAIGIEVSGRKPIAHRLKKKAEDISLTLYQQTDTIKVWASATKFLSCTAKIEVFAKEGKGGSKRKLTEIKKKIKKGEKLIIPISFGPPQRKVHRIKVRDSILQVSISDPQAIDGDIVEVKLDNQVFKSYELDENETALPKISLHGKKKRTLNFTCISKGKLKNVANLCKVTIKNSRNVVLAEYILQMPDLNDPSKIYLEYED